MPSKKNLVIVESNAKAKTIEKYLENASELRHLGTFSVVASMGHLVDLPAKDIGIDMERWRMDYVPIPGKGDMIKKIKALVREHDVIYLAADPDREGEAIAKNIYDLFRLKKENTKRVTFHEITKHAIIRAMLNPRDIDHDLVDAQEARRMLDRIVGYKLSPLLWRRFTSSGLSAGRVQSVALRLVVHRYNEASSFKPENLWKIQGSFQMEENGNKTDIEAQLEEPITARKDTEALMKELARRATSVNWDITFEIMETKKSPSAPFITSTLQQEASDRHGIGAKRTMQLAQALYEAGHITYMRTDSTTLSDDAKKAIHAYVRNTYGEEAVTNRVFRNRVANAQEAHECIRPTRVDTTSSTIEASDKITHDHRKIYDLIWRRAVASQMPQAVYLELKTAITSKASEMPVLNDRAFVGTTSVLVRKGYLDVWQPSAETNEELAKRLRERAVNKNSNRMNVTPIAFRAIGDVTRPPPLYNEPVLVKALEKHGIGRPSTYATIIEKLFNKGYVSLGTNPQSVLTVINYQADLNAKRVGYEEGSVSIGGNDMKRIVPSKRGIHVTEYLEEAAPDTVDVGFTASMEEDLDRISKHELDKNRMMSTFYQGFSSTVELAQEAQREARKNKDQNGTTEANKKDNVDVRPKNVIRVLTDDANIVQTRYGPALFIASEKRFVSISPFMKWKKKNIDQIDGTDAAFLSSLPISVSDAMNENTYEIAMGKYGLYARRDGNNYRIGYHIWNTAYNGSLGYDELEKDIKKNQTHLGLRKPAQEGQQKSAQTSSRKKPPRQSLET